MYQCWQTHVCNKLEKFMCSSSGHNQVRRGSDHRHRLAQAGQKFLSNPLSSLCQAMILCCFFCELELSNILLYFDTSLVLTIKTRENAEANIIIKNKEVSLVLSLFPILFLLCVKQCFFSVFFRILELSNILSMLFQNTSLVLTTTTTRENADCRTKNNR